MGSPNKNLLVGVRPTGEVEREPLLTAWSSKVIRREGGVRATTRDGKFGGRERCVISNEKPRGGGVRRRAPNN